MNRYEIRCTEEQTKLAHKLGADIPKARVIDTIEGHSIRIPQEDGDFYLLPTAEQMIGWLEEQKLICNVNIIGSDYKINWKYEINLNLPDGYDYIGKEGYNSRKEATLAAINAAFEYLTKNKK